MLDDLEPMRRMVLLVDDAPEALSPVIDALESAGLTALIARDGLSALAILERVSPDLVLLDAMMPGLNGFDTCRRIKTLPQLATTPVVFMTGLTDAEHVLEGLRAGGVDYMTKPINPDELIARVTIHIANAQMINEARDALDAGGRGIAAFEGEATGALAWMSPRAAALLGGELSALDPGARAELAGWLALAAERPVSHCADLPLLTRQGEGRVLQMLGRSSAGDLLVRVAERIETAPGEALSKELGVSEREGEVLAWLARGKSNKDIAAILELSPRTVTKHIEQIFQKLGVENRTAAAAIALRILMP